MDIRAFACAAVAAVALTGLAPRTWAGNLPLIQDGLVMQLDASDTSTMTLLGEGQLVTEWRSKVGDIAFGLREGQNVTNAPYYQASATCGKIPALVFGFPTNYTYLATTADQGHTIQSYLTADRTTTNRTVILVAQSLNNSANDYNGSLFGYSGANGYLISYMGSYSRASINANSKSFFGDTGLAWVGGTLSYDYAAGIFLPPDNDYRRFGFILSTISSPQIHVLIAQARTDKDMFFAASLGKAGTGNEHCPMLLSEVVVYDRVLTDAERSYLKTALTAKWKTKVDYPCWTGNGGDGVWETAANWDGNEVPADGATVVIDAPTTVTITGKVDAAQIYLGTGAGLTVDAGATLACSKVEPLSSNVVTVNGTMDYNVKAGATMTPSAVSLGGSGIIGKRGRGTLALAEKVALAPTLVLRADDGFVDPNGTDRMFRSVLGGGTVTNTSDTAVTLEIASDAACALEAKVTGNISLKKSGSGELSYAKNQAYTGATILAGGTMKAVKNIPIQTIPGLEIHLDASRVDTLTLREGDNAVLEWRSLAGDGLVYKPPRYYTTHDYYVSGDVRYYYGDSYYEAAGIAGTLPCIRCGILPDGKSYTNSALIAAGYRATTNRTVIVVLQNVVTYNDTLTPFGNYQNTYNPDTGRDRCMIEYYSSSGGEYRHSNWNNKTNDIYFNARQVWSREAYEAGTQAAHWAWMGGDSYGNNTDRPSVLTVVVPDDNTWGKGNYRYDTFKTCVGAGRVYHDGNNPNSGYRRYVGRICEVLSFNRALPDAERREIETYLMEKWINAIPNKAPWRPGETQFANTPASKAITVDAQNGTTLPCLTTIGGITLTDITLNMMNVDNAKKGTILSDDTAVTGAFKAVTGQKQNHQLVYKAKEVIFRVIRGLLVIVK